MRNGFPRWRYRATVRKTSKSSLPPFLLTVSFSFTESTSVFFQQPARLARKESAAHSGRLNLIYDQRLYGLRFRVT